MDADVVEQRKYTGRERIPQGSGRGKELRPPRCSTSRSSSSSAASSVILIIKTTSSPLQQHDSPGMSYFRARRSRQPRIPFPRRRGATHLRHSFSGTRARADSAAFPWGRAIVSFRNCTVLCETAKKNRRSPRIWFRVSQPELESFVKVGGWASFSLATCLGSIEEKSEARGAPFRDRCR